MTGRIVRLLGVAGLAAAFLPLVVAAPAQADPLSSCTSTSGTIVAVDYGKWGGPIVRGCGVSSATGYELLHDGGFTTVGTQHDGPAFICRIGSGSFHGGTQYPTPEQDGCVVTPPATAYWSYWLAEPGDTGWTYSQLGAMSYHPKPGEVELWRFGATSVDGHAGTPPYSPATLRAAAAPRPSSSNRPAPSSSSRAPAGSGSASTSGTPSTTVRSGGSSRAASSSVGASSGGSSIAPSVVAATQADPPGGSGSATPAILGAVGVVVLAGVGGAVAWRRRHQRGASRAG